jgi:hypothetical protein
MRPQNQGLLRQPDVAVWLFLSLAAVAILAVFLIVATGRLEEGYPSPPAAAEATAPTR